MKKKILIAVDESKAEGITNSLKRAAYFLGNELVNNPEAADVIIVSNHSDALRMLKENDDATVVIAAEFLAEDNIGIRTLKERYPERIIIGQYLEHYLKPGDVMLVNYIKDLGKENLEKEKKS
ncbi:MAG: hypothetical protein WCX17_02210 [Parcubacteria group bacterium]|jgi:hypothetical protein